MTVFLLENIFLLISHVCKELVDDAYIELQMHANKKKSITTGWAYQVTINKWQGKNIKEIFQDRIFIQRIVNVLLRSEKRMNFFQVRIRVVDSAFQNRCLLLCTERKLCRFVSTILKVLKLYGFNIEINLQSIKQYFLGNINT